MPQPLKEMTKMNRTQQTQEHHFNSVQASTDTTENQYLTFLIGKEEYAINILCVQEIRSWEEPTPLPNTPSQIKGVINLRGSIIPLIDLRQLLGIENPDFTALTVTMIIKFEDKDSSRTIGLVVDGVSDVHKLSDDNIKDPPKVSASEDTSHIKGIADINENMVIVLDTSSLLVLSGIEDSLSKCL